MEGYDYAWGWASSLPGAIKKAGGKFVVRYLGPAPDGKCIGPHERDGLHAAGLGIGLVYETTGATYHGGHAAGVADGAKAKGFAEALGAPAGTVIWFAIDEDTRDDAVTNAYLRGCQSTCGPYVGQLYGSYHVVEAAAKAGLGTDHWMTYAWSGGSVSSHAALYQYHNGVTIGGVDMDKTRTLKDPTDATWLRFDTAKPTPAPAPKPTGGPTVTDVWNEDIVPVYGDEWGKPMQPKNETWAAKNALALVIVTVNQISAKLDALTKAVAAMEKPAAK